MFTLRENEEIVLRKRKHWFVLFRNVIAPAVALVAPFVLYSFVVGTELPIGITGEVFVFDLPTALLTFLGSAWSLIVLMWLANIWTDYYLDLWIVTNMRIVDMEQKSLFHRQTSTFRLDRIQDVTVEIKGIIATFLNFGDIHVQTAGESQEFVMRGIANPRRVRESILDNIDLVAEAQSKERVL